MGRSDPHLPTITSRYRPPARLHCYALLTEVSPCRRVNFTREGRSLTPSFFISRMRYVPTDFGEIESRRRDFGAWFTVND